MKKILFTFAILFAASLSAAAQLTYLMRSTPEEEGVRSRDVLAYIDTLMRQKQSDMHGVMVLRNGKVIAEKYNEPFGPQYSHTQYSASKTFTAVAVGMAIQDSLLHLTDRLVDFVSAEMLPAVVSDSLAMITVEDLLTMRSGFPVDTNMRTIYSDWIRQYLSHKLVALPGTRFAYDSIDTYLLSAIVQKVEGMTLFDLLKARLFTPMGITQVAWEQSPEGITCGGWGLYIQLESMAKFGQLLLQRGEWNGQQLISADWIDQMTQLHATQSNGQQYGYQIWLTDRPGMVRCDGAWGQYIYVIPDRQMVVAMTQCKRGGKVDAEATNRLCQAVGNNVAPLPESPDTRTLRNARYRFTPTRGRQAGLPLMPVKLTLSTNPLDWRAVEFTFNGQTNLSKPQLLLKVTTKGGETFNLTCDHQQWHMNEIKGFPLNLRAFVNNFSNIRPPFYAAASYGWTTDNDLYIRLHYVNWISSCLLHFHFAGNRVEPDIVISSSDKRIRFNATVTR